MIIYPDILFVGQAPGKTPGPILGGRSGTFLGELLGVDLKTFLEFRRTNLNERFGGKGGKGDSFDKDEGFCCAQNWRRNHNPTRFVLLGYHVFESFGFGMCEPLTVVWEPLPHSSMCHRYLLMPHPSCVNLFWNDKDNKLRAINMLRSFCGGPSI